MKPFLMKMNGPLLLIDCYSLFPLLLHHDFPISSFVHRLHQPVERALLGQGLRSRGHEAGDKRPLACW